MPGVTAKNTHARRSVTQPPAPCDVSPSKAGGRERVVETQSARAGARQRKTSAVEEKAGMN